MMNAMFEEKFIKLVEENGGFDYAKPEPKKKTSFLDLFK